MARVQKNAAGEDVRVDTPAYGCKTVEHAKPAPAETKSTTKSKAKAEEPSADKGDE